MYITHSVHVPHPVGDCIAAIALGPRTWFPGLELDSHTKVGVKVAGLGLRKRVAVELGDLKREGSWAEIPITWKATGVKGLFPMFNGKMQLAPVEQSVTRLTVSGMYKPPLGRIGMELDDAVMHNVAEATLKELAETISSGLESASR